jgi:hypothetical protein
MGVRTLSDLREVFANKVIPLLQEYFYGNPAKIGLVLGTRLISPKKESIAFATGDWGLDDLEDKIVYRLADPNDLSEEDFISVYAPTSAGL